jgi:hypothetical protein
VLAEHVVSRSRSGRALPRWLVYAMLLGAYLTLRGYHSFDGDQAYRLPLLLHRQDPRLYAGDPFVAAFANFNPHRGSILLLDLATRPLGLSGGLFALFVLTFAATCTGIDRLARGVWNESGPNVGLLAIALALVAKAGNIGTNHLFEAMVLDRLIALALGWVALAAVTLNPDSGRWPAMAAIALACVVHPSAGLQLAIFLGASCVMWACVRRWTEVSVQTAASAAAGLGIAAVPGLLVNLSPGRSLVGAMPRDTFWQLSIELQNPQHMLPHLWRMPQWLAFASYLGLAALAFAGMPREHVSGRDRESMNARSPLCPPARLRLAIALVLLLAGLAAAWFCIEVRHHLGVTVFQPFRMATVARGMVIVMLSGYLLLLWRSGGWLGRLRAVVIAVALAGDWLLVEVTAAELAVAAWVGLRTRLRLPASWRHADAAIFLAMLARGLNFLGHHDTERGHIPLLGSMSIGLVAGFIGRRRHGGNIGDLPARERWQTDPVPMSEEPRNTRVSRPSVEGDPDQGSGRHRLERPWRPTRGQLGGAIALVWAVPLLALLVCALPADHPAAHSPLAQSLIHRCRFAEVPADDIERLALWCRGHTPEAAHFVGPPGPKTFRLWSRRSLAFNRAASPYHGSGLADWFGRFQDHVDFHGAPAEFVAAYVNNRHGFESRYDALGDEKRAALAIRQGASHVVAAAPRDGASARNLGNGGGPLELLHVEGQYAVYRVRPQALVQRH